MDGKAGLVDDYSIRVAENIEVDSSEQQDQNHPNNTVQLVGHPLEIKLKNEIEQTIARCKCKKKNERCLFAQKYNSNAYQFPP